MGYPLDRCLSSAPDADTATLDPSPALCEAARVIFSLCDVDSDGAWLASDWEFFWNVVYGRPPSSDERETLSGTGLIGAAERRVLQWFLHLIREGRGDSLWAVLRAFGYDGVLSRKGLAEAASY